MIQRHKGNRDAPLFGNALDVVVLDEAHLYAGTLGGEIAMLLRRVRERCGRGPSPTTFLLRAKSRRGPTPPPSYPSCAPAWEPGLTIGSIFQKPLVRQAKLDQSREMKRVHHVKCSFYM